jgi:hypothetical protein
MSRMVGGAGRLRQTAALLAPAAAISATTGAVLTPSEGEGFAERFSDKASQGAIDAALGAGLQAGGSALRKSVTGLFRPTPDAVKLMERGITPTLAQGAESRAGKSIGSLAAGAQRVRDRQREEIGNSLFRKITEGKRDSPGGTGNELVDDAQDYVSREYDAVFGNKRFSITEPLVGRAAAAASTLTSVGGGAEAAGVANRIIRDTIDQTVLPARRGRQMTQRMIQGEILTELKRKAAETNDPAVIAAVDRARQVIINSVYAKLTPEQLMRVKEVDRLNYDLSRLKEATAAGRGEDVGLDVTQLKRVYGKAPEMQGVTTLDDVVGPAQRKLGNTPATGGRSDLTTAARIAAPVIGAGAFGSVLSLPAVAPIVAGLYGLSVAGQTAGGARFLMGQTNAQKKLAKALRSVGQYGYGAGQAMSSDPELEE